MFAVVLDCVLCNLSTAAFLAERERAHAGNRVRPGGRGSGTGPGETQLQEGQVKKSQGPGVTLWQVLFGKNRVLWYTN